jgi:hypothetical protein
MTVAKEKNRAGGLSNADSAKHVGSLLLPNGRAKNPMSQTHATLSIDPEALLASEHSLGRMDPEAQ